MSDGVTLLGTNHDRYAGGGKKWKSVKEVRGRGASSIKGGERKRVKKEKSVRRNANIHQNQQLRKKNRPDDVSLGFKK